MLPVDAPDFPHCPSYLHTLRASKLSARHVLIVCPKAMIPVWLDHCRRWVPEWRSEGITADMENKGGAILDLIKRVARSERGGILVVNYEKLCGGSYYKLLQYPVFGWQRGSWMDEAFGPVGGDAERNRGGRGLLPGAAGPAGGGGFAFRSENEDRGQGTGPRNFLPILLTSRIARKEDRIYVSDRENPSMGHMSRVSLGSCEEGVLVPQIGMGIKFTCPLVWVSLGTMTLCALVMWSGT